MVASKLGYVGVMGDEVLQKGRELVPLPKGHVTAHEVLMHHTQVEVVAEGVNVHQVPHLIALLCEQHGQLRAETHTTQLLQEHNTPPGRKTSEPRRKNASSSRNIIPSNLMKELLYRRPR